VEGLRFSVPGIHPSSGFFDGQDVLQISYCQYSRLQGINLPALVLLNPARDLKGNNNYIKNFI